LAVPDELRGRPAQIISQVHVNLRPPTIKAGSLKWLWLILLIPVLGVAIAVLALAGALVPITRMVGSSNPPTGGGKTLPFGGKTSGGFATEVQRFGSEGIGPGMFKDARSVGVDGSGNIYVGEYSGGRVQVFDSAGQFQTQWMVDPKMPLRALAADRKGTVYVVQSGMINRYEGASGKLIGSIPFAGGWGFDDVVTTPDGGLLAAWYKNRDDIVRFNSSGQVTRTISQAISSITDQSELDTRVAADGLGNIYALGTFNSAVFKFSSEGKFVNKFGGSGDQPGQFRAAHAIAVDGKGRVFVSDISGIEVFDSDGRYLQTFKVDGAASGMVFNDKNELFVVARKQVMKFVLN
jgi:DNA-binding beta-propeller fold protein YncE